MAPQDKIQLNHSLSIGLMNQPKRSAYFSYYPKLLHEKNINEKLDSVKKLITNWPSRGLSSMGR